MGERSSGTRLNIAALRGFFMGVVGWPPRTVLHEASLRDLAEAYEARTAPAASCHRLPPAAFLREMLARFPDKTKE